MLTSLRAFKNFHLNVEKLKLVQNGVTDFNYFVLEKVDQLTKKVIKEILFIIILKLVF